MGSMNDTLSVLEQLRKLSPQAIILFGSAARGEMKKDSDLDFLVVIDSDKPFTDRMRDIRTQIKTNTPLDLIVLTPQEVRELPKKSTFFSQVIKEGKLLYGRI